MVGCYTLRPAMGTQPLLGSQIALDINDAGRAALGGSLGPEVSQIEGRLSQHDSSEYVVAVSMIHLLRGGEQVWSGEKVRVKAEHVSSVYERELSKSRSAVMGALGAGALVYMVTRAIVGSLQGDDAKFPSDTGQSFRRYVRP